MIVRQLLTLRSRHKLRSLCPLFFFAAVICYYVVVFSSLPSKFPALCPPWKQLTNDTRPRAFYRWIDESGLTLNGTKPPVYGLFVLLDLDSSSCVTSRRDGTDASIERLVDCDFGFSSCHQVPLLLFHSVCATLLSFRLD